MVNASVEFDTSMAETNDSLENTVDYVDIYNAIKKEMDTPSKLLEVVMERIISSINQLDKNICLLYTSPSPRDFAISRMPSSA